MDPILYSAVGGGTNDLVRQDIIANNLANVNTPGFKADMYQAQVMYLTDETGAPQADGQSYIVQMPSEVNTAPGGIITTGRPLDVAVSGNGYLALQGPNGEVYTRSGSFHTDADGLLLNDAGMPVLGDGGIISLPPSRSVVIGNDGTISVTPLDGNLRNIAVIDRIKTVNLSPGQLKKDPQGYLILKGGAAEVESDPTIRVVSGALEDSNVNAVDQMVQMISANRDFESQMKIISTVDTNADKLAQILQD